MINTVDTHFKPRIMITGETAGTGASTTARILADHLRLPIISGGKYFRGIANRFSLFQTKNPSISFEQQYQIFLEEYQSVFSTQGLAGISILLDEGIQQGAKGDVLATFHTAVVANQKRTGQIDTVWDYIVDQSILHDALQSPGFIWESKLAVLALNLDQLQVIIMQSNALTIPYLRVVLMLDPAIAAQRVGERENRQVEVDEILVRKQNDFDRYGELYRIGGQKVSHQSLAHFADVKINTQYQAPTEVARQVLISYLEKIALISETEAVFALPAIMDIRHALSVLSE